MNLHDALKGTHLLTVQYNLNTKHHIPTNAFERLGVTCIIPKLTLLSSTSACQHCLSSYDLWINRETIELMGLLEGPVPGKPMKAL